MKNKSHFLSVIQKTKPILYIDMDNVLVNFQSGIDSLSEYEMKEYEGRYDEVPGIFAKMHPYEEAINAYHCLTCFYDVYILSTAPWNNPSAWSDKLQWVKKYLGKDSYKRLILTHHKDLNIGDFLIDDRTKNGADSFNGELILFGSDKYPNWRSVVSYLVAYGMISKVLKNE